jgi:hypothetical protein
MPLGVGVEWFQFTNIGGDGKMPILCGIWRKKEKFLYLSIKNDQNDR